MTALATRTDEACRPEPAGLRPPRHPLALYRQRNRLTAEAFAKQVPCGVATINRIETGHKQPSFGMLKKLVAATGREVSADDFINYEPPARVSQPRRRATKKARSKGDRHG